MKLIIVLCLGLIKISFSFTSICNSCQNILNGLKHNDNINCLVHPIKDECQTIYNKWHSMTDENVNFYRNNQINICETCYRLNLCHINDCKLQKELIKNVVHSKLAAYSSQFINSQVFPPLNSISINNKFDNSNDNFYYFDFLFNKIKKIVEFTKKYEILYQKSIKLLETYDNLLTYYSSINSVSYKAAYYINDNIINKWDDVEGGLKAYWEYFQIMKHSTGNSNGKLFLSTTNNEANKVDNMMQLQDKIVIMLDKIGNVTEIYKSKLQENIDICKNIRDKINIVNLHCYSKGDNDVIIKEKEIIVNDKNLKIDDKIIQNLLQKCKISENKKDPVFQNIKELKIGGKSIKLGKNKKKNQQQPTITSPSSANINLNTKLVQVVPIPQISPIQILHPSPHQGIIGLNDLLEEIEIVSNGKEIDKKYMPLNINQLNPLINNEQIGVINQPMPMPLPTNLHNFPNVPLLETKPTSIPIGISSPHISPSIPPKIISIPVPTSDLKKIKLDGSVFEAHDSIKNLAKEITVNTEQKNTLIPQSIFLQKNEKKVDNKIDIYEKINQKLNQIDQDFLKLKESVLTEISDYSAINTKK